MSSRPDPHTPHHAARHRLHRHASFGQRAADTIASTMGSWAFIIAQSIVVAGWVVLNIVAWVHHWDTYPFILLNLLFSTQAAYAAPVIMMSQNRQAQRDRIRDDLEASEVDLLFKMNAQQLQILHYMGKRVVPEEHALYVDEQLLATQIAQIQKRSDALERSLAEDG